LIAFDTHDAKEIHVFVSTHLLVTSFSSVSPGKLATAGPLPHTYFSFRYQWPPKNVSRTTHLFVRNWRNDERLPGEAPR
jgi:hypothetical protein